MVHLSCTRSFDAVCLILALLFLARPTAALTQLKFRHWFPRFEYHWLSASETCNQSLNDYWTNNRTQCWSTCACAADCLLDNTTETIKANMASATVILGLIPSILPLTGPSLAETAVLSARSPLLAVMISLGSPATRITGLFNGIGQLSGLVTENSAYSTSTTLRAWHVWMGQTSQRMKTALRVGEYILIGAAIANACHVSVWLDLRSVSGWRCGQALMPLMWSVSNTLVHALGMMAIRIRSVDSRVRHRTPTSEANEQNPRSLQTHSRMLSRGESRHSSWVDLIHGQDQKRGEALFWLTSLLSIVHMIFGVLVLSSLLFVAALDALPVLLRYAASEGICQAVLQLEIATMRLDLAQAEALSPR